MYSSTVDIDSAAVGYMIGKAHANLNPIKEKYADKVKIVIRASGAITSFVLTSSSANSLECCSAELEALKARALNMYQTVAYRHRLEKEKDQKRRFIMASNKIREEIETEMKTRHREEVNKKILNNIMPNSSIPGSTVIEDMPAKPMRSNNKFSGLDLED